jgi:hypothetical protein
MVGPIDYTMQVLDPIQGYMKGLAFGEDIQNSQLGREQTRQNMGIQQSQEARSAQAFEMQKAEATRKQADALRGQQVLSELLNNPNPTSQDFTKAYLANPAIREEVKFLMGNQSAEATNSQLSSAQNLYAAAAQNNVPIVERLLTEQRDAAKNGGNEQIYKLADEGLKMLQSDPDMALKHLRTSTGLSILGLGGDIKKINEAIGIGDTVEFRPATAQESAQYGASSGQINTKTGEFKAIQSPSGMTVRTTPEGGMELVQGPGVGAETGKRSTDYVYTTDKQGRPIAQPIEGTPAALEAQQIKGNLQSSIGVGEDMLRTIESVVGRPSGGGLTAVKPNDALNGVLGLIEGRLPARTQAQADLLAKIDQISGRAFLEAFATLKGGGQITETEGAKATQALARLQRTQSPEAFQAALYEFADIVRRGIDRSKNELSILPEIAPNKSASPAAKKPTGNIRFDAEGNRIE